MSNLSNRGILSLSINTGLRGRSQQESHLDSSERRSVVLPKTPI